MFFFLSKQLNKNKMFRRGCHHPNPEQVCSKCLGIVYCSEICAEAHWPRHMFVCAGTQEDGDEFDPVYDSDEGNNNIPKKRQVEEVEDIDDDDDDKYILPGKKQQEFPSKENLAKADFYGSKRLFETEPRTLDYESEDYHMSGVPRYFGPPSPSLSIHDDDDDEERHFSGVPQEEKQEEEEEEEENGSPHIPPAEYGSPERMEMSDVEIVPGEKRQDSLSRRNWEDDDHYGRRRRFELSPRRVVLAPASDEDEE